MARGKYEIWITNSLGEEKRDDRKFHWLGKAIEIAEALSTRNNKVIVMIDDPNSQRAFWSSVYGKVTT